MRRPRHRLLTGGTRSHQLRWLWPGLDPKQGQERQGDGLEARPQASRREVVVMSIDPSTFEPEGEDHQDREKYRIDGPSEADWALRKLAQARKRMEDNDSLADEEMQRIAGWQRDANKPHERD